MRIKKSRRRIHTPAGYSQKPANYFFLLDFEDVFGVLEVLEVEDGVVFFVVDGLAPADLAFAGALVLAAAGLAAAAFAALVSGVVFTEVMTGNSSSTTGLVAACFAASRQLGKKSSIRWREMELARRQRGQCASWWFWCFSSMVISAVNISARPTVNGV